MREIKFRGKSVETGEWVYGSLVQEDGKAWIVGGISIEDAGGVFDFYAKEWYEVIPETVGQHTGWWCKGGKEVREHYLNNAKRFINEAEKEQEIQLNEDQQIVLEWLKAYSDSDNGDKPISSTWYMLHLISENLLEKRVRNSYFNLTEKQQFEVLQAFAEWGLSDK